MVIRGFSISILIILLSANLLPAQTPGNADTKLEKAAAEFYENNLDRAYDLFSAIMDDYCGIAEFGELCLDAKIYKARVLRLKFEADAAIDLLKKTEGLVNTDFKGNPDYLVQVYQYKVYAYTERSQLEKAHIIRDKLAEKMSLQGLNPLSAARAAFGIGFYEDATGNYNLAIEIFQKGLSAIEDVEHTEREKKVIIQGLNNLGVSYRKAGMPEKAMEKYLESVDLIHQVYNEEHISLSYAYNNIGTIYYGMGDFGLAAEYFERSATIVNHNLGWDNERIGAALNNAGVSMFQLGNYQKAAEYLEEAQRVKIANLGENHIDTAVGYSNLASIYIMDNNFDEAERNYLRSIEVRKANQGDNHPNLIDPKIQLGAFYNDRERFEESRIILERALNIAVERLGDYHPKVSELHLTLGNNLKQQQLFQVAIEQFSLAIQRLYGEYVLTEPLDVERNITDPAGLVFVLRSKAEVYRKLFEENSDRENLLQAKELYSWAMNLVDFLQRSYQSEASKLNLLETNYSIYTESVDILYRLNNNDPKSEYLEQTFDLMEKSRSRVALELLQDLSARTFAGLPASVHDQERELNSEITRLMRSLETERQKGGNADSRLISQLSDSLFYARRSLERFTYDLEQNYPSYYQLKFDQQTTSLSEMAVLLGDDTTLLSYMAGDESLYLFMMSSEGKKVVNLGSSEGLEEQVMKLRNSVTSGNTVEYVLNAYELYEKLMKPVIESVETNALLILPDQSLHYLPFEMLLTEQVMDQAYHRMPYLIKKFDISYAPSATVFSLMQERKHQNPRNLLALAPFSEGVPGFNAEEGALRHASNLEPLLLTSYETREIDSVFRQRRSWNEYLFPNRTRILQDSEATKNGLLQHLGNYDYIHFATHAFVNEESPEFSGIALYPDNEDGGITYVGDIYNLQLNADLVVLGACETGLGSVHRGEGMIGFTRAFIYAGTANLAVSMWRVNDQPTATMMINFYSAIRDGNSYSHSLRQAKLSMIENPATAAPRNWAAFVLHGR